MHECLRLDFVQIAPYTVFALYERQKTRLIQDHFDSKESDSVFNKAYSVIEIRPLSMVHSYRAE